MLSREFPPLTYGHQPEVALVRRPATRASPPTAGADRPPFAERPCGTCNSLMNKGPGSCSTPTGYGLRAARFVRSSCRRGKVNFCLPDHSACQSSARSVEHVWRGSNKRRVSDRSCPHPCPPRCAGATPITSTPCAPGWYRGLLKPSSCSLNHPSSASPVCGAGTAGEAAPHGPGIRDEQDPGCPAERACMAGQGSPAPTKAADAM